MIRIQTSEVMERCRQAIEKQKEDAKSRIVTATTVEDISMNAVLAGEMLGLDSALMAVYDVLMGVDE